MPYFIYITTNSTKNTLYVGMTNDLSARMLEHGLNAGKHETFAGKYHCNLLLYYEEYKYVNDAIQREKEIKKWRREKKNALIESLNPDRKFLNEKLGLYPFGDYSGEKISKTDAKIAKEFVISNECEKSKELRDDVKAFLDASRMVGMTKKY